MVGEALLHGHHRPGSGEAGQGRLGLRQPAGEVSGRPDFMVHIGVRVAAHRRHRSHLEQRQVPDERATPAPVDPEEGDGFVVASVVPGSRSR